ncbi:MAG: TetR/AcrR family transcriptional regulator [Candidatus Thiodiazotropha sp. LLP2]
MPYSAKHKQQSRKRILESAARCFLHQGYDQTGINEIMRDAGMTHGAFYAHFSCKSELYDKAMTYAAKNGRFTAHLVKDKRGKEWFQEVLEGYLDKKHLDGEEMPCPLAFLATDIATREPEVRDTYTRLYKKMNRILGRYTDHRGKQSEELYALTAMMIGGVALSRAVNDPKLVERLLKSCRDAATRLLNNE